MKDLRNRLKKFRARTKVYLLTSCFRGETGKVQTRARAVTLIWLQSCKHFAIIQNLKDFVVKYFCISHYFPTTMSIR